MATDKAREPRILLARQRVVVSSPRASLECTWHILEMLYESIVSNRAKKVRVGNQFRPAFAGFRPETTLSLRNSSGLLHFAAHLGRFQNSQKNPRRYCLHCL